jgi:hypothetical protein
LRIASAIFDGVMQERSHHEVRVRLRQRRRNQSGNFEDMIDVRLGSGSLPFLGGMFLGGKASRSQHILYVVQFRFSWVRHLAESSLVDFLAGVGVLRLEQQLL